MNVQVETPAAAEAALRDRGYALSTRAGGLRLSPHFYNTTTEIEEAIAAVADVATPIASP